jgi:hypothetical protein
MDMTEIFTGPHRWEASSNLITWVQTLKIVLELAFPATIMTNAGRVTLSYATTTCLIQLIIKWFVGKAVNNLPQARL